MLKRLKYFQSVVRLNSFSEAAEENYISQSAISQQIQALERELGFKLLERRNRTFDLTSAGEYFYQKSLALTADFERMCGEAAFLRNDGDPGLATLGVLSGGIFNVFGDYFFVFTCDMGIYGAGLATAIGSGISFAVMLTHFARRRNTLRLVRTEGLFTKLREISVTGFSTFFIDVAMGILTVLFSRQIMKYLGANALAIYGPIIQVSTFAQCCAYSVGQAAQPIISTNYGAGKGERIKETLHLALLTTVFFGVFWTGLSMACPNVYIRIFMAPTPEILDMAPAIIRTNALSFLLLPFNIFSTYYFQAIMKPRAAFIVLVARGLVISGILIMLLPVVTGADSLWFAMPVTELAVMLYAASTMGRYTKALHETAAARRA